MPTTRDEMNRSVYIDYTNHRGERSIRHILPIAMAFFSNEWHPEEQWLLISRDIVKDEGRSFAVKDIHRWSPDPLE